MIYLFFGVIFRKKVKTAVPDDGNPPGALVLTKLVEWHQFEVGDEIGFRVDARQKNRLRSVRKPREQNYARARSTPPKLEKRARKVGGFAAHFACGFFESWRGGTRSRIIFGKVLQTADEFFVPL